MSSTLTILDRLLDQAGISESKEHVLEQASYAVSDVQKRLLEKFEQVVTELSDELGQPEFNASTEVQEGGKNPMPGWVMGGKAADASQKVLRLSYWKRETGISYVILRTELDAKDRPKYYDLVLGARRRSNKGEKVQIGRLRNTDTSFVGWIKRILTFKKS
jgi:hypothetical protein